jgi:hypothetical protein
MLITKRELGVVMVSLMVCALLLFLIGRTEYESTIKTHSARYNPNALSSVNHDIRFSDGTVPPDGLGSRSDLGPRLRTQHRQGSGAILKDSLDEKPTVSLEDDAL